MPVAKEQIRQIIADNNISSVADVYTLLRDGFKDILQELMEAELDATLGYEKNQKGDMDSANKRNGHSPKKLKSQYGEFQIDVPRDRNGEFEPKIVPKYQRDVSGIEEKVISLYGRGMSTRDIHDQLQDLYGIEISAEMVSKITDKILPEIREWQSRPLNPVYPFVFMDCIHYKVREDGRILSRAAYVVLGVTTEGYKEILSITVGANESSNQRRVPSGSDPALRHPHAAQLVQICELQRPEEVLVRLQDGVQCPEREGWPGCAGGHPGEVGAEIPLCRQQLGEQLGRRQLFLPVPG